MEHLRSSIPILLMVASYRPATWLHQGIKMSRRKQKDFLTWWVFDVLLWTKRVLVCAFLINYLFNHDLSHNHLLLIHLPSHMMSLRQASFLVVKFGYHFHLVCCGWWLLVESRMLQFDLLFIQYYFISLYFLVCDFYVFIVCFIMNDLNNIINFLKKILSKTKIAVFNIQLV